MKINLILVMSLFIFIPFFLSAQVKVDVEQKINTEANTRANQQADKAIDKAFDKLEEGIGGLFKKKNRKSKKTNETQQNSSAEQDTETIVAKEEKPAEPQVKWNKFDFISGDQVIFEDGPNADEENGEFPSRWDLVSGNSEIGEVDGENVIMFLQGGKIIPYLKDSEKDNLPEIFTIEFDLYFKAESPGRYWVSFYDYKNQWNKFDDKVNSDLEIFANGLDFSSSSKRYPGREGVNWNTNEIGIWIHISIAYTNGKFKAYMDDTRLINIPHLKGNPTGFTIWAENNSINQKYLKNIRIAKGGVKYYDRVLSDGKIIVNGIRFDVNKATIKPESNGAINNIFKLMQKQPELNFSVEGHTDSDGDDDRNMELSKARGKAVMEQLISMGIAANRLKSTGWGESKPIGENGTAEGKANNRRVEFVKF
ncbi:MAG: OmpA family protein [Draconibacterium sp.]|nr:OmpA family protein [Draconibacterium sp.]